MTPTEPATPDPDIADLDYYASVDPSVECRAAATRASGEQLPAPPPLSRTSRWRATTTTLHPVTKLVITHPPWLVGVYDLTHIPAGPPGAFTAFYGALILLFGIWWTCQVWTRGRFLVG
jgi:hypothetical protein